MLKGIHFLLTYMCNLECDHCFLYSKPSAKGTFTTDQIEKVLDEAVKLGTVETIYFEGGEPFLYYPVMLEGLKSARDRGFKTGVVTNGYFVTSEEDAELWLRPLRELGISDLSISDDSFHSADEEDTKARTLQRSAEKLGLPAGTICIEKPVVERPTAEEGTKGEAVVGGGAKFRGRAVEKLVEGLPLKAWKEMNECPYEDLKEPSRVHVDAYGNVHLCQGLTMGNMWDAPLSDLVNSYDPESHPICGPLLRGGPALLAEKYDVEHAEGYVDPCHLCYLVRKTLLDRFPECLTPKAVYGLE
jgi:MoaA/NifB/PqqE/SkfB family radical SAM enzyme